MNSKQDEELCAHIQQQSCAVSNYREQETVRVRHSITCDSWTWTSFSRNTFSWLPMDPVQHLSILPWSLTMCELTVSIHPWPGKPLAPLTLKETPPAGTLSLVTNIGSTKHKLHLALKNPFLWPGLPEWISPFCWLLLQQLFIMLYLPNTVIPPEKKVTLPWIRVLEIHPAHQYKA